MSQTSCATVRVHSRPLALGNHSDHREGGPPPGALAGMASTLMGVFVLTETGAAVPILLSLVASLIPVLILFVTLQRYIVSGTFQGATKG